jgi:hypothetical protein
MSVEGHANLTRGGPAARWDQRSRESFEEEVKVMRVVAPASVGAAVGREPLGDPAGNGKRSWRTRGRPTTRYRTDGWRSAISFDVSSSDDPEDPANLTEAVRGRLGDHGIPRAPDTLQRRHPNFQRQ